MDQNTVPQQIPADLTQETTDAPIPTQEQQADEGNGFGKGPSDGLPPRRPYTPLYKTRLCRGFQEGTCSYGDKCSFAHGEADLRAPTQMMPPRRHHSVFAKTKMCNFVANNSGPCPYGDRCNFAHSTQELRPAPQFGGYNMFNGPMMMQRDNRRRVVDNARFKTRLCRSFMQTGMCRFGDQCAFAHGQHDLRGGMMQPTYEPYQGYYNPDMSQGYQQGQFMYAQPPPPQHM